LIGGSKRGNAVSDTVVVVVAVFVLALFFVYSYKVFDEVKPSLDEDITDPTATVVYTDLYTNMPSLFDYAIAFVLVLLWAAALLASFFIDSHPAFFVMTLLLFVALVVVGALLANTYEGLIDDTGLGGTFPIMDFVFSHFVGFVIAFGFSIAIALFGKSVVR